jgi:hypothetical protein
MSRWATAIWILAPIMLVLVLFINTAQAGFGPGPFPHPLWLIMGFGCLTSAFLFRLIE